MSEEKTKQGVQNKKRILKNQRVEKVVEEIVEERPDGKLARSKTLKRKRDISFFGLFLMDETSRHSPGVSYHYWYLKFIQDILKYDLAECVWLDFHDEIIPIIEASQEKDVNELVLRERFAKFKNNPFLMEYQDEPLRLAEDILANGMYVPFLMTRLNGEIRIKNGSHRLNSLRIHSQEIQENHRKYPCIILKEIVDFPQYYLVPWIYNGFAFYVPIKTMTHLTQLFDLNGGEVTRFIHVYNKAIDNYPFLANLKKVKASEYINDHTKWEEFINHELNNDDFNRLLPDYALGYTESLIAFEDADFNLPSLITDSFEQEFQEVMKDKPDLEK